MKINNYIYHPQVPVYRAQLADKSALCAVNRHLRWRIILFFLAQKIERVLEQSFHFLEKACYRCTIENPMVSREGHLHHSANYRLSIHRHELFACRGNCDYRNLRRIDDRNKA